MISSPMTDNTNGTVSPFCLEKIPANEGNRAIVSTWFGKLWLRLFNLFEWETSYRWSTGLLPLFVTFIEFFLSISKKKPLPNGSGFIYNQSFI